MKRNINLMYIIVFLQGLVFYGPVATLYRQSRGLDIKQIFILESIFVVLMLLFEIPWGYFADKFGYKKTLLLSHFMFFISKIIFYEAHSFLTFLLESITVAIAISGQSGCDSAIIYESIDKTESEKVFSRYSALGAAGFFSASLLSTIIVRFSMDLTALLTIIPYGISFLAAFFLKDTKNVKNDRPSILQVIGGIKQNKRIFLFVISMALISETTHSVCIFLNQPQYIKCGISVGYFGLLTALMQIVCIVSAKSYKLSSKIGQGKLIVMMFLIITISIIMLTYTSSAVLSILLIMLTEAAFALCQPLSLDMQNKSIATGFRATILSTYAMIGDITSSGVNLCIGSAAQSSLEKGILLCGVFSGFAVVLSIVYFRNGLAEKKIQTISEIQ